MPSLQLRYSVHPYHPVDTCQGAVNFPNGAVPSGARLAWLSGRRSCYVCDCESTVEEEEEEEEAVFISVVNTNEDPPNAHQAQHRPVQATGAMSA